MKIKQPTIEYSETTTAVEFAEPLSKSAMEPEVEAFVSYVEDGDQEPLLDEVMYVEDELLSPEYAEEPPGKEIPGVEGYVIDEAKDDEEEEEEPEKTWENDRDVNKFMTYLLQAYPHGIPKHDGKSVTGCERASVYLKGLLKEISEAIRMDVDNVLDPELLEDNRVKMMSNIIQLNNHKRELEKDIRSTAATEESEEKIVKEATTAKVQMVATPFERAIVGILINATVSAGHPFEDVYELLKKKYDLTEREELAVMQLAMDSGFHIFKDRGTFSEDGDLDPHSKLQGVDFIKNYFA